MPLISSELISSVLVASPMALSQTVRPREARGGLAADGCSSRCASFSIALPWRWAMLRPARLNHSLHTRPQIKGIVGAYTTLSIEGIAATVCASFLVSPRRSWWRESICNAVSWAILVRMRERQLRVTDQFQSDL